MGLVSAADGGSGPDGDVDCAAGGDESPRPVPAAPRRDGARAQGAGCAGGQRGVAGGRGGVTAGKGGVTIGKGGVTAGKGGVTAGRGGEDAGVGWTSGGEGVRKEGGAAPRRGGENLGVLTHGGVGRIRRGVGRTQGVVEDWYRWDVPRVGWTRGGVGVDPGVQTREEGGADPGEGRAGKDWKTSTDWHR